MITRPLTRPAPRAGYRLLIVIAGTVLAVWAGASQAFAHNSLTSVNPANQETVQGPPPALILTFDDPVIASGARVMVTGPSGQIWRLTSADGAGTFSFTPKQLPTSPQTSPPTTPTQTNSTRMPGWLKLLIGVVAIIFAITVAGRASRRRNGSS